MVICFTDYKNSCILECKEIRLYLLNENRVAFGCPVKEVYIIYELPEDSAKRLMIKQILDGAVTLNIKNFVLDEIIKLNLEGKLTSKISSFISPDKIQRVSVKQPSKEIKLEWGADRIFF